MKSILKNHIGKVRLILPLLTKSDKLACYSILCEEKMQ